MQAGDLLGAAQLALHMERPGNLLSIVKQVQLLSAFSRCCLLLQSDGQRAASQDLKSSSSLVVRMKGCTALAPSKAQQGH